MRMFLVGLAFDLYAQHAKMKDAEWSHSITNYSIFIFKFKHVIAHKYFHYQLFL